MRVIISGGGTGGHIYPAIAIADKIKEVKPEAHILFVGAEGKMEMEKVPKAGYEIIGLPVRGLQRKLTLRNLVFPFRLLWSIVKVRGVLKRHKPDIAIGVGGYASGPCLKVAKARGVKTLLQEQNSYPGITNKLLGKGADAICVAYPEMEKFFPKEKLHFTGNPVRGSIKETKYSKTESLDHFGLDKSKKTILLFGGSLGARTLNEAMKRSYDLLKTRNDIQWIWQMGSLYYEDFAKCKSAQLENVKGMAFIDEMGMAYEAAEIAVTRAGALSISELAIVGKASILVPSPNVAEDHQTKNAMALVNKGAAQMVKDNRANELLVKNAMALVDNKAAIEELERGIKFFAKPNASALIVEEVLRICSE